MEEVNLVESVKVVSLFALLALLPFVLILMTAFTRISIVLTFLRQALSTTVPSAQIIFGLSIILTGYVMHPVINDIAQNALFPYLRKEHKEDQLLTKAWPPLRQFMLANTREKDLELFIEMGKVEIPADKPLESDALAWYVIIPSFVLSELRVAFMMGFLLFLPFLVVDMVVSSLLMSMGMFMLPPTMISFPFKLLLFIMVDGWQLIVHQIIGGFHT